ncbi:MAG TPA: hypothetical protein VKM94_04935 [Blastocatellia bacterium]|nr:hypothetical protein [Blastocatellia bacterium]
MVADSAVLEPMKVRPYRSIFVGGLIAGAMDITAACINSGFRGRSPIWVLQSVAAGVLGLDAFSGGLKSAAVGLVVHFTIATTATTVFFLVSRRLRVLLEWPVVCGVLYGIAVYAFMNLVVLRLAYPVKINYTLSGVLIQMTIHMICVGLPISLVVRHYSK